MHLTLVSITALLLTSFPCIAAIDSINAPSSVKAGTDFVVSVNPGPENPAFSGDHFTAYRIYLAIAPPEKIKRSLEPVCYLAISSTVSSTEFTVQIPADIGPSGPDSLAIATRRFNERGDKSDISYSDTISFTGGTGNWTQYELEGGDNDPDNTPCSSYACTKECSQKFYPETKNATTIEEYHNTYSCWLACPGTTYKSWDDFLEAYWKRINGTFPGSDDGGPDTCSSISKSTSATKSATTTTDSSVQTTSTSTSSPPKTTKSATTPPSTPVNGSSGFTSTNPGSPTSLTMSGSGNIEVDLFVLMSASSGFAALLYTL
jgi:hypothetical protein